MKRILITGAGSFIGTALDQWLKQWPDEYRVDTLDMRNPTWHDYSFAPYDVVFHVAGLAHSSSDPKLRQLYYAVNRDLAVNVAKKAKADAVKQFILMSSILVYGDSRRGKGMIDLQTRPDPTNFYGDSKLQAERGIQPLSSAEFRVGVLRPPMIYGKGCKGNYPRLAWLAKRTPVFPDICNQRSMLHIDNLCAFVKAMIDTERDGLFFPQNREYVRTSELVATIAAIHGRKIWLTKLFNPLIGLFYNVGFVKKVFGSLAYDKSMSSLDDVDYQIHTFEKSIELTEQ